LKKLAIFFLFFLCPILHAQSILPPSAPLYPYLASAPEIYSHSAVLIDAATGTLL
jgi:D-alanyl-D-alanine carboxypeptidase